jgi:hypothetical protein
MDECLDLMRKTQKLIKDSDIELFLLYNPEVAVQIVNDLIDEPSMNMLSNSSSA